MKSQDYIPVYQRLVEFYKGKIISQEYTPGIKIDSINKMMSKHSVSRETAKRVLQILRDENLVISKAGKGSFVKSDIDIVKVWGMVIPFSSSNIEQLIASVDIQARKRGRKLKYYHHYNNPDEEMRIIGNLIQSGYESIIVVPNYDESLTANFYRRLMPGNTRIVLADNTMAGSYFKYVIQSYDLGVKRAVDYLACKNEGNFLLLRKERWQGKNLVFELMEQTFRLLIQEKYPDRKVFVESNLDELNANFFRNNNISAVLSIEDSGSIRLIGRLKQWGFSIPQEVAIVSYGNTELTEFFSPSITCIDCNYREMAEKIARLIERDSSLISEQIVIQPELIIRET